MPQPSTEDDASLLALVQSGDERAMASIQEVIDVLAPAPVTAKAVIDEAP